jgi:hypothetical protein
VLRLEPRLLGFRLSLIFGILGGAARALRLLLGLAA